MKLKELNIDERPRERLLAKGSAALGNAELLAILLRTGSGKKNVLEMSHELLAAAGDGHFFLIQDMIGPGKQGCDHHGGIRARTQIRDRRVPPALPRHHQCVTDILNDASCPERNRP